MEARNYKENLARMQASGTPMTIDIGFEQETAELSKNSREFAKRIAKSKTDTFFPWEVQQNPELFSQACFLVDVPRESLNAFTKDVEDGKLGKSTEPVREMIKFHDWEKKGFPNGVFVKPTYVKLYGFCNLLMHGHRFFNELKFLYPWLKFCRKQTFVESSELPLSVLKMRANRFLGGSYSAKRGNILEKIGKDAVSQYGYRVLRQKKIRKGGTTWDLCVQERIYSQISFNQGTGGIISYKRGSMLADVERGQSQGKVFMFLGGGPGWTLRNDTDEICRKFDYCFGNTVEQYVEFLYCILHEQLGVNVTRSALLSQVKEYLS